jgi:hypothetical protein
VGVLRCRGIEKMRGNERKSCEEIKRTVYQENLNIKSAETKNSPFDFRILGHGHGVSHALIASPNISGRRGNDGSLPPQHDNQSLVGIDPGFPDLVFLCTRVQGQNSVIIATEQTPTRRGSSTAQPRDKKYNLQPEGVTARLIFCGTMHSTDNTYLRR